MTNFLKWRPTTEGVIEGILIRLFIQLTLLSSIDI